MILKMQINHKGIDGLKRKILIYNILLKNKTLRSFMYLKVLMNFEKYN